MKKIREILKTKRAKYLIVILLIVSLILIINVTFASFSSENVSELLTAKVSSITNYIFIDEKAGSILEVKPNTLKPIEVKITSEEDFDSKYEIIYDVCTDKLCDEFITNNDITVEHSSLSKDKITDEIDAYGQKFIRLVITNNTEETIYLKIGTNAGFSHNTLELKNNITNEHEDNFLQSLIFNNYEGMSNIKVVNNEIFSTINEKEENNLYKTLDDLGFSYYLRGNPLNNNIVFAGMLWKITRINGDGSIRLIYNKTCIDELCNEVIEDETNVSIFNENYNESKYVSYNEENSNIKTHLDLWYKEYIEDKEYNNYLTKTSLCIDTSNEDNITYGTKTRLEINKTPNLRCKDLEDKSYIIKENIGLLSADEASLAGLKFNTPNNDNYLKTNYSWWTLSPYSFDEDTSYVMNITNEGSIFKTKVNNVHNLRPVISLKSSVKVTGLGTEEEPYKLV